MTLEQVALTGNPYLWACLSIPAGIALLAVSILMNFLLYDPNEPRKRFRTSAVDTLSMSLFAVLAYLLVAFRILMLPETAVRPVLTGIGLLLFHGGIAVNLAGRWSLGRNWSDQIRIRQEHTLVQSGIYRFIRHPLYASSIWMLLGAGLVFQSASVLISTAAGFIPMMVFRARQEEALLRVTFPGYDRYRQTAGMFFPKLPSGSTRNRNGGT